MKSLIEFSVIHEEIPKAALEKFSKHLYLSKYLTGLSLFDSHVPLSTKRKVVEVFQSQKGTINPGKSTNVSLKNFHEKKINDFVTKETSTLFKEMNLPQEIFQLDPEHWTTNSD